MQQDTTNNLIIKIDLHSVIDVITNSSTEIFVCDTDKSLRMVKQILQELLDWYSKYSDYYDGEIVPFDDVFREPYISAGKEHFPPIADVELGKVIIEGRNCAIPESLINLIVEVFHAEKHRA